MRRVRPHRHAPSEVLRGHHSAAAEGLEHLLGEVHVLSGHVARRPLAAGHLAEELGGLVEERHVRVGEGGARRPREHRALGLRHPGRRVLEQVGP